MDISFFKNGHFILAIILALFAELKTFLTVPIAGTMGLSLRDSASIAMVGGADGPMALFTSLSLSLSKELFVPITVVAYLYLGLCYGGYPYLVKAMVPKRFRAINMTRTTKMKQFKPATKLAFAIAFCGILCFLFPVAAPLFFSLFIGIVIRESGLKHVYEFISGPLYGSTFMLGVLLGVLCEAHLLLDYKVLLLLILGILALLLSGIGGILGGYAMYFIKKENFNLVIGIAAVSCVPTTAKVAQKIVSKDNPNSLILPEALGANITGVISTAIIIRIYVTIISLLEKM
jgi:oxaloacetate decarboxylase beta subunit